MARLTFLGAARTVTGSQYLVEAGTSRVMVDCGMSWWAVASVLLAGIGAAFGYGGYRSWCGLELGRTDLGAR
jgi:hypothetical protein